MGVNWIDKGGFFFFGHVFSTCLLSNYNGVKDKPASDQTHSFSFFPLAFFVCLGVSWAMDGWHLKRDSLEGSS